MQRSPHACRNVAGDNHSTTFMWFSIATTAELRPIKSATEDDSPIPAGPHFSQTNIQLFPLKFWLKAHFVLIYCGTQINVLEKVEGKMNKNILTFKHLNFFLY